MTKEDIRRMRIEARLTQQNCADLLKVGLRTWQRWEYGERKMSSMAFELFKIKTKRRVKK